MKRYPSGHLSGDLPLHVLDFLLGVSRRPEEIDRLHAASVAYDSFAQFDLDRMEVSEFLTLWARNEAAIVADAKRRGVPVPDPRAYVQGCWVKYGG